MRHAPIAPILALQAFLLLFRLDLLPLWTDEMFTFTTVSKPVGEIVEVVQRDIHPPLYFVLLRGWARLPLPWDGAPALRAFSAFWALAVTVLVDYLFARRWRPWRRWTVVAMVAFSPCLMLYGRMARSYSMQAALALVAAAVLWRWMSRPDSLGRGAVAAASLWGLLYTHYAPGLALAVAFCLVGWRALGLKRLAVFVSVVAVGYLPWALTLGSALRAWGKAAGFSSRYLLTGNLWLEQILKIGFGTVSLGIGETFPAVSLVLAPVVVGMAWYGLRLCRQGSRFVAMIAIAGGLGYLGVARWVSFPFTPARLLWLLPFLMVAAGIGISRLRMGWRVITGSALLASSAGSAALYFQKEDFLNPGYAAPMIEIGERLNREAGPGDLILVDAYNTDGALCYYFSGRTPYVVVYAGMGKEIRARAAQAATVWMVRNTRDISPDHSTTRVEEAVCAGRERERTLLEPYGTVPALAMRVLGVSPQPSHFYQVTACRAQGK